MDSLARFVASFEKSEPGYEGKDYICFSQALPLLSCTKTSLIKILNRKFPANFSPALRLFRPIRRPLVKKYCRVSGRNFFGFFSKCLLCVCNSSDDSQWAETTWRILFYHLLNINPFLHTTQKDL
jgi:hypothetical protein